MHVDGSLMIKNLNGFEMNDVLSTVFWLDRDNNITNQLTFKVSFYEHKIFKILF